MTVFTSDDLSAVRSLLFTPADRPERFSKAVASGADGVVLDLEDAVAAVAKTAARDAALNFLAGHADDVLWVLRINHFKTQAGLEDLLALRRVLRMPAAIMLPKVESPGEVDAAVAHLHCNGSSPLIVALIESSRGLGAADAIAAHPAVGALAFGGADLAADMGAEMAWEPLLFARSRIVQAAAASQIAAWDVPFLDLRDDTGLTRETVAAKALGYSAKLAIHPAQVGSINAVFSPTQRQVERAQQVVAASARSAGGVCVVEGKMIDQPVVLAAQRTLQLARRLGVAQRDALAGAMSAGAFAS
ncbi:MAG: CoA ester lyase [Burkholderiaceae bacterium]|nr:CoA ester lyase [Burkholderiaceae bacterium]